MPEFFETCIYIASTNPLFEEKTFKKLYDSVPEYRKRKIDSYANQKEKCLSLGAGLLLSKALKDAGYDEDELEYSFKESGMPYFKDHPEINFSLTHCNQRVMCGISTTQIGVDVEFIADRSPEECRQWTKMESYAKATDISMASLMGGKNTFSSRFHFYHPNPQDGYDYSICSDQVLSTSHIKTVLFK